MRPIRLLLCLLMLMPMALAPRVGHAAAGDASAFMTDIGNRVLAIINDKQAPEAQRKEKFRQLANSAFEVPKIAQFVLGRYWRTASEADKQRFITSFETYMIQVYWSRFTGYNGEAFKVTSQQDEGNGTILVVTQIVRPNSGQPPIKINWSMVKRGDSFKIQDVSLDGVSQALTYRDEFSSIIERNGGQLSALIDQLNQRVKG
jgi:phospholipid transport system substrate-binding protein